MLGIVSLTPCYVEVVVYGDVGIGCSLFDDNAYERMGKFCGMNVVLAYERQCEQLVNQR